MKGNQIFELKKTANEIRKESLIMIYRAQSGHPGGSLSEADILAALYFYKLRINPKNPLWEDNVSERRNPSREGNVSKMKNIR